MNGRMNLLTTTFIEEISENFPNDLIAEKAVAILQQLRDGRVAPTIALDQLLKLRKQGSFFQQLNLRINGGWTDYLIELDKQGE